MGGCPSSPLHGVTSITSGLTILEDPTTNDLLQTMAHEIGHALGLGHVESEDDLMFPEAQPKRVGCQLRLADWDTLNPRDPE